MRAEAGHVVEEQPGSSNLCFSKVLNNLSTENETMFWKIRSARLSPSCKVASGTLEPWMQ